MSWGIIAASIVSALFALYLGICVIVYPKGLCAIIGHDPCECAACLRSGLYKRCRRCDKGYIP